MTLTVKVAIWTVGVIFLALLLWGILQAAGHSG